MTIKRSHIEIVDFSDEEFREKEDEDIYYCRHCLSFGFKVPLKNRVYPEGEHVPVDHDQFRQCHECGLIVPVYELQKESEIKDVVEKIDNPLDIGKNEFLGVDSRKLARKKKGRKQVDHDYDYINDRNSRKN